MSSCVLCAGAAIEAQSHTHPEYSRTYTEDALPPAVKPGLVLYVGVDGSDENPGTEDAPLRTLEAARDVIRELKLASALPTGSVHVVLLAGHHHRDGSFRLSAADSGTLDAPIVYRGVAADQVVLAGGVRLDTSRFTVVESSEVLSRLPEVAHGKVISIDLSNEDIAQFLPGDGKYGQISMDGHLLQLAQWPNRGYHHIDRILTTGPTTRWLKPSEKPTPHSKAQPTGGEFTCQEGLPGTIQVEFQRTGDMQVQGYLHNDWYFQDEPVGRIQDDVIQLLRHTRYGIADKIKSIPRRVRLVNVLAALDEPGEWYFDRQDERLYVWPIDGFTPGTSRVTVLGGDPLLQLRDTKYVTFRDLTLENSGDVAVEISDGEHNLLAASVVRNGVGLGVSVSGGRYNGITGCEFHGLEAAFRMSGGNMRTLEPCYHFATNNIIHDCRRRGYGLISLSGVGLHFAHNLLYNLNGAVHFRTVNLLLEYNEFYHIGFEMGDFNVAYCGAQWYTMNNVIRYNFVHHLLEPGGHPVMAFRNDDGGAGLKIYGNHNYAYGVREPFHIHGSSGTVEGMESDETGRFADLPRECVHELPWPISLDAFVDVPSLDLRFRREFQPRPEFRPIPFEKIGLVQSRFRLTLPDKDEYRQAVFDQFKNDRSRQYDPDVVNGRYPEPSYLRKSISPN